MFSTIYPANNKIFKTIFTLSLFYLLTSCSDFYPLDGTSPVASEFIALKEDDRILYKEGMRDEALLIQNVLDEMIKSIEEVHAKPFTKRVVVHLCDTRECFAENTGINSGILAAVGSNGLFLKSYLIRNEDYASWLAHELSHLHLLQQISLFKSSFIPPWYKEGLATYASNGGGADKVSRDEAIEYILQGKHIIATHSHFAFRAPWSLNYVVSSDDWDIPWYQQHMDYTQAAVFYEFLHPRGGVELLRSLEAGTSFSKAFQTVYKNSPEEMFDIYRESVLVSESNQNI